MSMAGDCLVNQGIKQRVGNTCVGESAELPVLFGDTSE